MKKPDNNASPYAKRESTPPPWGRAALELIAGLTRPTPPEIPWERVSDHVQELRWRQIDSLAYLGAGQANSPEQRVYDKLWAAQCAVIGEVTAALKDAEVHPLLIKGGEIVKRYFGNHALGMLHDVDILVRRHELGRLRRTLYKLDFLQGTIDPETGRWMESDIIETAAIESNHYELHDFSKIVPLQLDAEEYEFARYLSPFRTPVYVKDDGAFVLVTLDVHHAFSKSIGGEQFFRRAQPSVIAGQTLSREDHLWSICTRYYAEVAMTETRALRHFAYLAKLTYEPDLDWDAVIRGARVHDGGPALLYWIGFIDRLGGNRLDRAIIDDLQRLRRVEPRDWGPQLGKLFGAIEAEADREWLR